MRFDGQADCARYVEAALERVTQAHPGWTATPSTVPAAAFTPSQPGLQASPPGTLAWRISRGGPDNEEWYRLEALPAIGEFLIWFGNHQVGADAVYHVMRPAIHVAFRDLTPTAGPLDLGYGLDDVLESMLRTSENTRSVGLRFEPNTFSMT